MFDYPRLYKQFVHGGTALQVYEGDRLIFTSDKPMLAPLLEYIEKYAQHYKQVVIFDKILGNAAALLSVIAHCREAFSPLGSELAVNTLNRFGIIYHIDNVVPYIQKPSMAEMCPMEKLSIGKEPDEFYEVLKLGKTKNSC
jgi:hypothetical protein